MFSIIIEYKGGTFVTQIESENVTTALITNFEHYNSMQEFREYFSNDFIKEIKSLLMSEFVPVPLDGLKNVWYFHFNIGKNSGHCHLIKTCVKLH